MSDLHCRGIVAGYNGTTVLDGVDVTVAGGEWVAVIGPNGSGKTTLLRVVAGMHRSGGEVRLDGDQVESLSKRARASRVAVVPQTPVVPGGMTVLDYVLLGRNPHIPYWGTESPADIAVVRDLLEAVDLAGFGARAMSTLSGGERQRAVLARALAQEAGILLLDEPTAALDLGHSQQVLEYVDELRRGRGIAVLSAVHDLTLAAQYADRLVLLDRGRVAAEGTPRDVLTVEGITHYYGASVSIITDEDGNPVVAPRRGKSYPI